MINVNNFRTKTAFKNENHAVLEGWNIGLDIGYSSVKGYSPKMRYIFPSYAIKKGDIEVIGGKRSSDIFYRDDETGEEWIVGEKAQVLGGSSTNENELSVFGRSRYFSEMFKVLARTGIGIGCLKRQDENIKLCLGLPPEYRKMDTPLLIEALSGNCKFSIKIGESNTWNSFDLTFEEDDFLVIDQPLGTLFNLATDDNATQNSNMTKLFGGTLLILDGGFGTLDIFSIKNGSKDLPPETIDNMGMKEVFKRVIADISKEGTEYTIQDFENLLEKGKYRVFNRKERSTVDKDLTPLIEKHLKKVCEEALDRITSNYNNLLNHDYLIVTGGTGYSWIDFIEEYFKNMSNLTVLCTNTDDDELGATYSNAKGYYKYAVMMEKSKKRK